MHELQITSRVKKWKRGICRTDGRLIRSSHDTLLYVSIAHKYIFGDESVAWNWNGMIRCRLSSYSEYVCVYIIVRKKRPQRWIRIRRRAITQTWNTESLSNDGLGANLQRQRYYADTAGFFMLHWILWDVPQTLLPQDIEETMCGPFNDLWWPTNKQVSVLSLQDTGLLSIRKTQRDGRLGGLLLGGNHQTTNWFVVHARAGASSNCTTSALFFKTNSHIAKNSNATAFSFSLNYLV